MQQVDGTAWRVRQRFASYADVRSDVSLRRRVRLGIGREVSAFREVLPKQSVRVFIRAALPRILRITEVDLDPSCPGKAFVISHFRAPVPGQRFI